MLLRRLLGSLSSRLCVTLIYMYFTQKDIEYPKSNTKKQEIKHNFKMVIGAN